MKILVTGANGLLGQKLVYLFERDPQVDLIATARKKTGRPLQKGSFYSLDVTDSAAVAEVIGKTKPDSVIHTAAMTQVDQCETERDACWNNNVKAVEYLVKTCELHGVHFLHLSTDFIFDGRNGPLDESAIAHPLNYYGESKLASEEVVKKSKVDWAIIRTVLVYGITNDLSRSNIVLWVKKSLEAKKIIQVVNDQWRTPTLAEDLAAGCALASKKKAKGVFNVSGSDMMTPHDMAIRTADFFELDKSLIRATDSTQFKQPAQRPLKTGFIIEKAKRELGYRPHTFQEGLAIVATQLEELQ